MHVIVRKEASPLLTRAQHALRLSQEGLGELLGVSRRTVIRWGGSSTPSHTQMHALARAVHPTDAELATAIAECAGSTLEALGIVRPIPPEPPAPAPAPPSVPALAPPAPPAPAPTPPAPPRPTVSTAHLVDSIVCAAAEAHAATPQAIRPALRAAFERALAVGLEVHEVVTGFAGERGIADQ